jgi:nucleoside-diphosphate kinase
MALERTLSIIKPDAVAKNVIGEISPASKGRPQGRRRQDEAAVAQGSRRLLRRAQASVRSSRPGRFMISGPVMIQALEGEAPS